MSACGNASTATTATDYITDGKGELWRRVNKNVVYRVSHATCSDNGSLIDNGSNGGVSGSDILVLESHDTATYKVNVEGVGPTPLKDLSIVQAAGLIETTKGPIIGIFNQYAHHGQGKTIYSEAQMKSFGIEVSTEARALGGKQPIKTPEGYVISLAIHHGLFYMDLHPPTDSELELYPHVIITSEVDCNPDVLDSEVDDMDV